MDGNTNGAQEPARFVRHGPAAGAVLITALWLGLTSFGGPIAHIGYFERTYVRRRQWLTPEEFTGLVALCQMIPGPASSQLGFLIGLKRAGWGGAFAAWIGFTLPSALLMFGFARLAPALVGPVASTAIHGLKLVAIAVVAQAVWSMGRTLCPDRTRTAIALTGAVIVLNLPAPGVQVLALAIGLAGGMVFCRGIEARAGVPALPVDRRIGLAALAVFVIMLFGVSLPANPDRPTLGGLIAVFYRSGALVFGGGHVVLPLLHDALVPAGWLRDDAFLAGYGAAQAMPGPLFTFAGYLGAVAAPQGEGIGVAALWSAAALGAIFLPGLVIAIAGVSVWNWVGLHPLARGALAGINAAVVGLLGAALYSPVWLGGITRVSDVCIAVVGLFLLERWRLPPILVVGVTLGASLLAG